MPDPNLELVTEMMQIKEELEEMKKDTEHYDTRSISVAITYLETSMLWFADARKGDKNESKSNS